MELLTPAVIATLAFSKVIENTAETITQATFKKINQLRSKIWQKLKKNKKAETAFIEAEKGSKTDLEIVVAYLKVAMDEDEQFSQEVQILAGEIQQEINIGKIQGQNVQNVYGGEAEQNNAVNTNAPVIQGGSGNTINIT